jgi:large subunit ribosomal protein L25
MVPVHFDGEAPAVKTLGGVFVIVHANVKVRCLPKNLPHSLNVSVAGLEAFHSSVSVKNLDLPSGVKVIDSVDTVLATVQEPRKEEEIVVAAAAPAEGDAAAAAGAEGATGEAATKEAAAKEGAAPAAEAKEKAPKK